MPELLAQVLPGSALVVAIDPGKVQHRVWFSTGDAGLLVEPVSVPALRPGLDEVAAAIRRLSGPAGAVVAIEATGALHGPWVRALEERFPSSVRVFAPSETAAARAQLGSRRFKSDDRDCAALTYLARQGPRQGQGRPVVEDPVEVMRAAVRYRRGLVAERKVAQQRLHDQLNALCPGLSAPAGHGRVLELDDPSGQAVLACVVAFAGRAPSARSLQARAPGRLLASNARYWAERWKQCLPPPPDAAVRAERLGRSIARWQAIRADVAAVESDLEALLATTDGQVLTTLPGVGVIRAAGFAAFSLPIDASPPQSASTRPPGSRRRVTSRPRSTAPDGSRGLGWPSTVTRSWASPGVCRSAARRSPTATPSCAPAGWLPSRPESPWPATPVD